MKLTDLKHDHSLTNLLKVIIFSILMLTPFFFVATKCLYVICNKNAYESYYGETINQVEISKPNTLVNGDLYHFEVYRYEQLFDTTSTQTFIYCNGVMNYQSSLTDTFDYESIRVIKTLNNGTSNNYVSFINNAGTIVKNIPLNYYSLEFDFYATRDINITTQQQELLFIETYNNYSYLDNVFEYSVNQMAQSQLFTWTQNTGVYTGANAMTTGLGLTSPVIPILISYWFLLTIIYVVIDIVIVCFTTITHMIVKKSN